MRVLLLEILPLGGMFLLWVGDYVTVFIRLGVQDFLFPLGGRHFGRMFFSPLGPSVLEPHLKGKGKMK